MSVYPHSRGATLIELLVSTVFVSILMAISYTFARAALMSSRVQAIKSEAQETTVMSLDVMAHELRMAGFSAAGSTIQGVRTAATDRVEVASDLNGDGDTDDSNERVAYTYDEHARQLKRATGGASPQPFVTNVASDGFHLTYFDVAGAEIATGTTGIATTELPRVHRIDVTLSVEFANPDPNAKTPVRSAVASTVCLRNQ